MTTLTRLSHAQQRILNVLYDDDRMYRADEAVDALQGSFEDIAVLAGHRFIDLRTGPNPGAFRAESPPTNEDEARKVWLKLTNTGKAWVLGDPVNKLLRAVDNHSARRLRLDKAGEFAGEQTVRDVVDAGYLTLHEIESQREVRLTDRSVREFVLTGARYFTVNTTGKIRQVLG